MQSRGGMDELMRQAARMQRKMDKVREDLKDREMTARAAGDKVEVKVRCEGKLSSITIDPEFLAKEGLELALDSVIAAANSALDQAEKHVEAEMRKVTGGIKLPGM